MANDRRLQAPAVRLDRPHGLEDAIGCTVLGPAGRLGTVADLCCSRDGTVNALVLAAGQLGTIRLRVAAHGVAEVAADLRRVILRADADVQLLPEPPLPGDGRPRLRVLAGGLAA